MAVDPHYLLPKTPPPDDDVKPMYWANYPPEAYSPEVIGQVLGPTTYGSFLAVVAAELTPDGKTCRLGLRHVAAV